jgi:hypothetical protein
MLVDQSMGETAKETLAKSWNLDKEYFSRLVDFRTFAPHDRVKYARKIFRTEIYNYVRRFMTKI